MIYKQGFIYLSEKEVQLPYLIFLLQMLCKASMLILNVWEHVAIAVDLLFQAYKLLFQLMCILRKEKIQFFLSKLLNRKPIYAKKATFLKQILLHIYCYNLILKNPSV